MTSAQIIALLALRTYAGEGQWTKKYDSGIVEVGQGNNRSVFIAANGRLHLNQFTAGKRED